MSSNKFFPNKPVPSQKLVGRKYEISIIFDQINNRGHVAIHGSSGMGKSSLLQYIKSRHFWDDKGLNFSEALIVYHNCEGLFTPNSFWQEILQELKNEAEGDTDLQGKIDDVLKLETIEIRDIRRILKQIRKRDKFLLLLLDDYHGILRTPEDYTKDEQKYTEMEAFLSGLHNLAVHGAEAQYFSTVVTAFQTVHELGPEIPRGGSPWYNHYLYVYLKPFSQENIDNYFFNLNGHFSISIPDNISKEEVLEITGRYPILLQHAGYIFSKLDRDIDINTFKAEFKNQTEHIFKDIWRELTANEQKLLQLIVIDSLNRKVSGKRYYDDDIDQVFEAKVNKYELTTLCKKGVIYQNSEQNTYNFSSSLMQDLVVKEFCEGISDPKNRKIFLDLYFGKIITEQLDKAKEFLPFVINIAQPIIKVLLTKI